MITRRRFLQASALLAGSHLLGCHANEDASAEHGDMNLMMPDESAPHLCTWMAFGAQERIWGKRLLPEVQRNLAAIARTIARFEPVRMLARPSDMKLARQLIGKDTRHPVELIPAPLDDLWMRDTGPLFVSDQMGRQYALDFNFNGWGNKQPHRQDAKVARKVAQLAGVEALATDLVLEGGCVELDGEGTAIITESCVLNDNRNPGVSKAEFEDSLMPLLGLNKIIWLPGLRGMDITDGHTDFYARFARPGVVFAGYEPDTQSPDHGITLTHLDMLRSETDAKGKPLKVITLEAPTQIRKKWLNNEFAAGYIGFYICNDAVIVQTFGDERTDSEAQSELAAVFPKREIVPLAIDGIAAGGGSIHCATQQQPLAKVA